MLTLDEALAAVAGRKEFAVKRYDGLVCFNYLIQLPDSFEGIRREFRGITFSEASGEVVSLPLHKFLNINQVPETQWDLLKDMDGDIYEKVDGSLIHFFEWKGDLRAATRMSSETSQAKDALRLAAKLGLTDAIANEVRLGYTPIFEYVAPNNQIVVEYPRPRLVYLHSRHRRTGFYRSSPVFADRAQKYSFRFADILAQLDKREFEGYVVLLSSGLWVKCKCPWYVERHRAVDALMRPAYRLYEVVYEGVMDDLIAQAPDRYKDKLRSIYTEAQLDLLNEQERIAALSKSILEVVAEDGVSAQALRKKYVMHAQATHKQDFGLLMTAYDNRDTTTGVKGKLLEGYKVKYPDRLFADSEPEE